MALSEIAIVNGALRLLQEPPVSDLNSQIARQALTAAKELAAQSFSVDSWRFASEAVALEPILDSEGRPLQSKYRYEWYVYKHPVGAVKIRNVFYGFLANYQQITTKIDKLGIHTISGFEITAEIVRAMPLNEWPIEFGRYIQAAVAHEIAPANQPSTVAALAVEMTRRHKVARQADQRDGSKRRRLFNPDEYIQARSGIGSSFDDDRVSPVRIVIDD